ncbi:ABC transporter permease [Planctomycetota bacterium]|nr:ABC transporter permease [Planctomycetota bacterium]
MDAESWATLPRELGHALGETGLMVGVATLATAVLGLPIGVLLFVTERGLFLANRPLRLLVSFLTNVIRSTPFVILLVLLLPLTQIIAGTTIGPLAASVPLSVAAVAFFARLAEAALREVDPGMIEAALSAGATSRRLIIDVLVWEALPGLVRAGTITLISLIGLSAMAGIVGGGGVGDLAIRFGYYRYETPTMVATVVVLVVLVQLIQWFGDWLAKRLERH